MSWFVAFVSPQKEQEVADDINAAADAEAYCPMRTEQRRPRHLKLPKGQSIPVRAPMFSRYIFFRGSWEAIHMNKHVRGVIKFGDCYASLDDQEIERIREIEKEQEASCKKVENKTIYFFKGSNVEIADGAFIGKRGVVISSNKREALVDLFAPTGTARVTIPLSMLKGVQS